MNLRFVAFLFMYQSMKSMVLHKFVHDKCGEIHVSSRVAPYAMRFGNMERGPCKEYGFQVFDHQEQIKMGPLGTFNVDVFSKSTLD